MKKIILAAMVSVILMSSCAGGTTGPKVVPGAAGTHLYDMMDEDSTDIADTLQAE